MTIIETRLQGLAVSIEGSGGIGVPAGGVTNQSLTKNSNADFDLKWSTPVGSGDMLKAIYDPDDDDKINYNDLANLPTLPTKLIYINSESDFPTQDSTTITLESDYGYFIGNNITTSKRFIVEHGVVLRSHAGFINNIVYTGTDVMFTCVDASHTFTDITLSCPNGTLIDFTGDGISIFERMAVTQCVNLGAFHATGAFTNCNWSNCTFYNITDQGLYFTGDINVFSYNKIYSIGTSVSHKAIDLRTATFQTLEIRDLEAFGPAGSYAISGLPNSGNISTGKLATVESCGLANIAMTPLENITISDSRWRFRGNSSVEDTIEDALLHFRNNTTNTVIAASSSDGTNAVKVIATWLPGRLSKFTFTSDGRITYTGERPITVPVDLSLHLISVGGGSVTAAIYFNSNNGLLTETGTTVDLSGNTSKNISIPWQIRFEEGDWIEPWVENNTNNNDILVKQGILRIR